MNGDYFLFVAGARPRDTPAKPQLVLDTIVATLPGCYDILYERDDERPDAALANAFTVRPELKG